MCFIRIRMDTKTPLYTFGDTAWTRGQILPKISYVFNILSFSHFFHKIEQKHNIAHLPLMFYPYVKFKNFPLGTFGDIAWTRTRIDGQADRWKSWNLYPLVSWGIIRRLRHFDLLYFTMYCLWRFQKTSHLWRGKCELKTIAVFWKDHDNVYVLYKQKA